MEDVFFKISSGIIAGNIITILAILLVANQLPPQVPLFFGLPYGEEQLAATWSLAIPPFISIAFSSINAFIINSTKETFIKQTLIGLSVVTFLLSVITVVKIIFLVGL